MEKLINLSMQAEQLGIAGFLFLGLLACIWAIRFLYKKDAACEAARLVDSKERAVMNRELGELSVRVDMMTNLHNQHLVSLLQLNNRETTKADSPRSSIPPKESKID